MVSAQRPTRDRVAHSQPSGCESWSRVVVSALIYLYIIHIHNTYHVLKSRFHLIIIIYAQNITRCSFGKT
ncbi:hypothetical protein HanRHA438_Chr11g0530111 [Helianthus annuus]|nr:hypothetical protein HanRHA438_Chr11g0530111 [Helianthus annuus]